MGTITTTLCLEIGNTLGDASPSFSSLASKHGTLQAYHGTKVENVWSILNFGLQNLSYNETLAQNGAMLGEGVYLTTARRVAESFAINAAERAPRTLSGAFYHESLLHLLHFGNADVANLDPLDGYEIKCLPVFEAKIIKPPSDENDNDNTDKGFSLRSRKRKELSGTYQEGKYYVCSNGEYVRLTRLYLTIELTKKSDLWQRLMTVLLPPPRLLGALVVLLLSMLWMILS